MKSIDLQHIREKKDNFKKGKRVQLPRGVRTLQEVLNEVLSDIERKSAKKAG